MAASRPHLLGIDDGPFDKFDDDGEDPHIVGVMMEGPDLVEAVAMTTFPVDGDDVTAFLARWIEGLRFRPALQGVLFGGITIAGLAIVDAPALAAQLGLPVLIVNRKEPSDPPLAQALERAGLADRIAILERAPTPQRIDGGLFVAAAGIERERAAALALSALGKSELPEPLRLAHLIARAVTTGESRRGR